MTTLFVLAAGSGCTVWLARSARRFAVLDRVVALHPGRRTLPDVFRTRLVRALDAAALDCTPEHAVHMWALAAIGVGALGFGLAPPAALAGVVAVGAAGPIALRALRHRRNRLAAAAVPDVVERVASELRAGGTVATALARLVHDDHPLAPDLARLDTRLRLGASLPAALSAWRRERDAPGVGVTAGALAMATTAGGRCADALEHVAESLRDRLGIVAETRALSAQARASAFVVGLGPLGYLLWTALVDRHAVGALVGTTPGRVCLVVGLALEGTGAWWMRLILRRGVPA
ncbi:MAG: type II secretion system F family protein [Actinomycetota bacterium]